MRYPHLGLLDWPFSVVPIRDHCSFIAGRPQLREDIDRLLLHLTRRDTSSLHVVWSWFGAGKTHSMYYIDNQTKKLSSDGLVPLTTVYSEIPKGMRSFLDLYRAFVAGLDLDVVKSAFLEQSTSPHGSSYYEQLLSKLPDVATALRLMALGTPVEQMTARRWLRADDMSLSQFRRVDLAEKIRSSEQATRVLQVLIELLNVAWKQDGYLTGRTIWLIDEFQRIAKATAAVRRDVNDGLHSTFNACPIGLTIMFSFSGQPNPRQLPEWFSPELRDRIGITKVLVLPPFQRKGAKDFIREVIEAHREDGFRAPSPYFPFTAQSVDVILNRIEELTELRPRFLMEACNAVLEEGDIAIENKEIDEIDGAFARRVLSEFVIVVADDE